MIRGVLLLMVLVGCGAPPVDPPPPPNPVAATRPSLLLLTLDTTRFDAVSDAQRTPALDLVRQRGATGSFTWSTATVTTVAHASILTGRYPWVHGVRRLHAADNRLPDGALSLAEVLKREGYATGGFVSAFVTARQFGFAQGFDVYDDSFASVGGVTTGVVNTGTMQRRADETIGRATEWIGRQDEPFFAWIHLFDPHDDKVLPPSMTPVSDDESEALRVANYHAELTWMDAQIGGLLAWLGNRGQLANTLVVVVADHGEGFGEHGWWGHGLLYGEQIRVPLLFMGPGVKAGVVIPGPTSVVDIVPTALDLLGVDPIETDGTNLATVLGGGAAPAPGRLVYADALDHWQFHIVGKSERKGSELYALTDGDWVYVLDRSTWGRTRLFHLPDEDNDRAASDPAQVERFRAALDALNPYVVGGPAPLDPETKLRLDALSYAGDE